MLLSLSSLYRPSGDRNTSNNALISYTRTLALYLLCTALISTLAACSLVPIIEASSIDYNSTVEDVSNTSLVINLLRGRDSAPLYFPDLSQIRGSITASAASQFSFPWGPQFGSTTRASAQGGPVTGTTNPTFDIAPTNTKQFYQGLLNPISKDVFAYFLERSRGGSSSEWVFHLLVSSIDVAKSNQFGRNISWKESDFNTIADQWTESDHQPIVIRHNDTPQPLGPAVSIDAKSIIDANAAGLNVSSAGNGKVQLLKKASGSPTLCFFNGHYYIPVDIVENSVIKTPTGEAKAPSDDTLSSSCPGYQRQQLHYTLHLRSVEQIFYYLGTLISTDADYAIRTRGPHKGCPIIAFFINNTPVPNTRFTVNYRGNTYYIADTTRTDDCGGGRRR